MQHNAHYFSDGHTPQLVIMQRPQVICEIYFHVKILTKIAEIGQYRKEPLIAVFRPEFPLRATGVIELPKRQLQVFPDQNNT